MKKLILFSILAFLGFSCSEQPPRINPGCVVIAGQVTDLSESSSKVMTVHFMNPFDGDGSTKARALAPDGSFRIAYEMPYGQSVNIQYGGKFIALYAEPGDSVHVAIDAGKLKNSPIGEAVRYSGDQAGINTEFTPAYTLFTGQMNADDRFYNNVLKPDEFLQAVKDRIKTSRDSLASYAAREKISGETVNLIEHEILNTVLYYASWYREGEESGKAVREKLFNPDLFDVSDSRYSSSQMYPTSVDAYLRNCVYLPGDWSSEEGIRQFLADFLKKMKEKPAGLPRDMMLYTTLSNMELIRPGVTGDIGEIRPLFSSGYAWDRLERAKQQDLPEFDHMSIRGISYINDRTEAEPLPAHDIFETLAERYPGKVIYIDISAHWCSPCLAEIPHMKTLHEQFEGRDVAFVVFWMNSKLDRCIDLIRKHDMKEQSYFFSEDAYLLFRGTYGFSGFPTYMLMDRSGKLVNLNAGRPSDSHTPELIQSLL